MGTFQVGKTYRSDRKQHAEGKYSQLTVASRTPKFITTTGGDKHRVITDKAGNEQVRPFGSYAGCPIIEA